MEIFTSSETMVKKQLNMALTNMATKYVFKITAEHTTIAVFPQPEEWFELQDHVTDSMASKTI